MWDLPEPGLEPVSPALAGGFLTTAPPGKSLIYVFWDWDIFSLEILMLPKTATQPVPCTTYVDWNMNGVV